MGLAQRMDAPAYLLSCGELRLLEVALALAAKPEILMLDEPAAGLNSQEARAFGDVAAERCAADLVRFHPARRTQHGAGDGRVRPLVVMHFGEKLAEGTPAEIQPIRA
jgi:branched-chain amino acid transport system ATP-binding protein